MNMQDIRWGSILPLIGGMTLGAHKATGVLPSFMLSYPAFATNDANIRAYYPDVPFEILDGNPPSAYEGADFITALCPCAGLSTAAGAATPERRAANNSWLYKTANTVLRDLKPKVFFGENAPTFFTNRGELIRQDLADIGKQAGYSFSCYLTNTMHHGVPQNRKRTFYFFWKDSDAPVLQTIRRDRLPLEAYLAEVQNTEEELAQARHRFEKDLEIQFLEANGGLSPLREFLKEQKRSTKTNLLTYLIKTNQLSDFTAFANLVGTERQAAAALRRQMKIDQNLSIFNNSMTLFHDVSPTMYWRTQFSLHPTEDRTLTVRESMHLMAMPSDFKLVTKDANAVCQSVPVCTAQDMTHEVLGFLAGQRESSGKQVFMQSNLL